MVHKDQPGLGHLCAPGSPVCTRALVVCEREGNVHWANRSNRPTQGFDKSVWEQTMKLRKLICSLSFLGLWSGDALLSRKIMCATNASHVVKRYIYFPCIYIRKKVK